MKPHCLFVPPKPANGSPKQCNRFGGGSVPSILKACLLALALASPFILGAAEPAGVSAAPVGTSIADTNSSEALRNYLQLQEQLHAAQLAIERNHREAADAASRTAETIASRLQAFEQTLTTQREAERQQVEGAYRLMVLVGGACAALGFVAMLLTAYFQWRAVGRLTEFSVVSQASLSLGRALPPAGNQTTSLATTQSNTRLYDALARIEQQIRELEHASHPQPIEGTITVGDTISASSTAAPAPRHERIAVLIAKGQSLLDLDKPEDALAVFNDILAIDPGHAETLVKKGDTLERLRRMEEAVVCYDDAIAADASFTIAYLHKGGLFNRMDRHEEALRCYEQALRAQEKEPAGSAQAG